MQTETTNQPHTTTTTEPVSEAASEAAAAPTVDFSAMDETSPITDRPKDGTYLFKVTAFAPIIDQEAGVVTQIKFALDSAEAIPTALGNTISESTRMGTFSMFVSQSQYRDLPSCIKLVKQVSLALNNIVVAPKTDPKGEQANARWRALDTTHKRPSYVNQGGMSPVMDSELEFYTQWEGTLLLGRLRTKPGANLTNLEEVFAASTPRAVKRPS